MARRRGRLAARSAVPPVRRRNGGFVTRRTDFPGFRKSATAGPRTDTTRRRTGASWRCSRRDIDSVAHQVTVALLDHIANMNANPEFNTAIFRYAGVAVDHRVLHLDGAAHGIDHAAELHESSVAGPFEHTPVMYGDGRIDEIAAQSSEPRQGTILVNACQPAETDNVGGEDCRKFPFF